MSSEVDRAAFLRMMGLTAADVADPDTVPTRTSTRPSASNSHNNTYNYTTSHHLQQGGGGAPRKTHSPVASSSVAGLSHSASLRGDSDPALHAYANTKGSLGSTSGLLHAGGVNSGGGGGGASPAVPSRLTSTFHAAGERAGGGIAASASASASATGGTPPFKASSRAVSFDVPPAAAAPRAASVSDALKEEGNCAFEAGLFTEAIRHYSAAVEALAQSTAGGAATPAQTELLAALHSNRSAAYLQAARQWPSGAEEAFGRALCDADRAVSLRPSWFKGYSRQGDAYFKLRRYGTAAESYEMALQLDPRNTTLANALAETRQRARQAAREELEMRRTMRSTNTTTTTGAPSQTSSLNSTARGADEGEAAERGAAKSSAEFFHDTSYGQTDGDSFRRGSGGRRSSGQAQRLWSELKHEVEVTTHEPTGDAYRLQQLERFRNRGAAAASTARGSFKTSARRADTANANTEASTPYPHGTTTSEDYHSPPPPAAVSSHNIRTTVNASLGAPTAGRRREENVEERAQNITTTPPPTAPTAADTFSASRSAGATSAPPPPPRRSSYEAPTSGGIPAAMANFSGPVTSARDVPYEFSSAAASAYQQQLLEAFRQRKARQP